MKKNFPSNHIELLPVTSSNIRSVGYRASDKTLKVKFQNGGVYLYTPVEQETYEAVINAKSVGKEFNALIKKDTKLTVTKQD